MIDHFQRDKAIAEYAPIVNKLAKRIITRLPSHVELDDLKSAGFLGLIDAIDKFSDEKGTPFTVYAEIRIRGAIMDELRAQDWVPRSVRDRHQRLAEAREELSRKLGQAPSDEELATHLGLRIEELHRMQKRAEIKSLLFIEDLKQRRDDSDQRDPLEMIADKDQIGPEALVERLDEEALLNQALNTLRERHQTVLRLYYYEDMKLKEIGQHLNITESRVSQILTESLERLKVTLLRLERGPLASIVEDK